VEEKVGKKIVGKSRPTKLTERGVAQKPDQDIAQNGSKEDW
jgi:hypothetical protein